MPDGNIADLYEHGALKKPGGLSVWRAAVTNYRTWIMCLTYGYCFVSHPARAPAWGGAQGAQGLEPPPQAA